MSRGLEHPWEYHTGEKDLANYPVYICVCALESFKHYFYIMFFAVLSSVVNPRHICWFIEYNYQFLSFEICKLANPLIITKLVIQLVKIRSRWAKMRDSFLVIIKGVIFAFFLFIYNTFWISKKNLATYTLQIFRNDICIFMRNSHLKEQWTGQKYRWKCMCIEARAHSLILKHSQYLIL